MEIVFLVSTPERDRIVKTYIDLFLSNGWTLTKSEPSVADKRNIRYTLRWPEYKGKAILPKGFTKLKVTRTQM